MTVWSGMRPNWMWGKWAHCKSKETRRKTMKTSSTHTENYQMLIKPTPTPTRPRKILTRRKNLVKIPAKMPFFFFFFKNFYKKAKMKNGKKKTLNFFCVSTFLAAALKASLWLMSGFPALIRWISSLQYQAIIAWLVIFHFHITSCVCMCGRERQVLADLFQLFPW